MRLRAFAFAGASAAAVAAGAWELAGTAVERVERDTREALAAAFAAAGEDWAMIRVDGLEVAVSGTAPDETSRFHAIELAHGLVDAARLHDEIRVASAEPGAVPDFAVEILRNQETVSLIGLVPAGAQAAIRARLADAKLGGAVSDMLETADHPAPETWGPALSFGLDVLAAVPRAQLRVAPGEVALSAVVATEEERTALRAQLEAARPATVALTLDLAAPRPVVAPFAVGFRAERGGGGHLAACSAETEADAAAIVAAARRAGLAGEAECRLGLGAPSPDWAEAATAGIAAVAEMGGGAFSLSDLEAVLSGPPDFDPARLAEIGARLDAALPPVFALATRGAATVAGAEGESVVYAPEFRAVLLGDGTVRLAGPLADSTAQGAVVGFAEALFGSGSVMNTTVLDPYLPEGWPGRVLSGIEALAMLNAGALAVTPDAVTVSGTSLIRNAEAEIEAFFAEKGGPPPVLEVAFDPEALATVRASAALVPELSLEPEPALEPALDPSPNPPPDRAAEPEQAAPAYLQSVGAACAEAIAGIVADEGIVFESGSATIAEESRDLVAAIAEALNGCPGARFEVAGHTDSSGSADANQRLSERRAAAVLTALEEADLDASVDLVAVGYGPDQPIADNDTVEGRARNRRIEFSLLPAGEAEVIAGADDAAE